MIRGILTSKSPTKTQPKPKTLFKNNQTSTHAQNPTLPQKTQRRVLGCHDTIIASRSVFHAKVSFFAEVGLALL